MASGTKNPFVYLQNVRQEMAKVSWPSRRETTVSTIMVLILSAIASLFLFSADQLFAYLISLIGLGR